MKKSSEPRGFKKIKEKSDDGKNCGGLRKESHEGLRLEKKEQPTYGVGEHQEKRGETPCPQGTEGNRLKGRENEQNGEGPN